jgi:transcriptional regulator with XRE-family HTH domain
VPARPMALTPYASAAHFFGAELRHHRLRAGLSLQVLGTQVFQAATTLGKIEAGQRYPHAALAENCDAVLGCGGALVRLHGLVEAERVIRREQDSRANDAAGLLLGLLRDVAAAVPQPIGEQHPDPPAVLTLIDNTLRAVDDDRDHAAAHAAVWWPTRRGAAR